MALSFPLISWGTVDNIANWTITAGSSVTSSAADPFGGTAAYTLTNNVASASMAAFKVIPFKRDGYQDAGVFLKQGTATSTTVGIFDNTLGAQSYVLYTWTSGVPSGSFTLGTGGFYQPVSVGNGWYFLRQYASSVVQSHTVRLLIYPSGQATVSGSVQAFVQNTVLSGSPVYQSIADDQYSDDSGFNQSLTGIEEAWTVRRDNRLHGLLRWVPGRMTDTPAKYSGFYGYNESIGVNVGFKEMIAAGRSKSLLRFCPDSSNTATYIDSYLYEPMTDGVSLEENGTRSITIGLRNPNGTAYEGY